MTNQHCIPNYFVGLLPIEFEYLGNIIMQREKLIAMRTIEKDEKYQDTPKNCQKKPTNPNATFEDKEEKQEVSKEEVIEK